MNRWTWRRVVRVLALVLNVVYLVVWGIQWVHFLGEGPMNLEEWAAAIGFFLVMVGAPATSLVALLWPPARSGD